MVLNDGPLGYTLNGKSFPATEPIVATLGQTVRIRFMNEGLHDPPHAPARNAQTVIAKDGGRSPAPWKRDTLIVAPGERSTSCEGHRAGVWAFHCHILPHAEARAWDVRHGDRVDRAEARSRMIVQAGARYSR